MMISLEAKIAGVAVLLIALSAWWITHNHDEQNIGAVKCLNETTETKQTAAAAEQITVAEHARILDETVKSYDQKIADLNANADSLAQRLHDAHSASRVDAVPTVAGTAGRVSAAARADGPSDCDRREAAILEACAANTIELMTIRSAWQRMATAKP
jgi:hypothetical protein